MEQHTIFDPFFAMILLTFVVWVYMYSKRIPFIRSGVLTPEQLTNPHAFVAASPPAVSNPSDNLKNLFEMPVLFYALVSYVYVTDQVDATHLVAAWIFVVFRALHSLVHCTFNLVILRFWLYFVATLALAVIAVRAGLTAFAA